MLYQSLDPARGEIREEIPHWEEPRLEQALAAAETAAGLWAGTPIERRCELLRQLAAVTREGVEEHARIISEEMGKPLAEASAELHKCATVCDWYATQAPALLADQERPTPGGRAFVTPLPLGPVLAIMPWNYPYWQVYRCAVPALAAGNPVLLKHAFNTPRCAAGIESLFTAAGLPPGVFQNLYTSLEQTAAVIADPRVQGVAFTGSDRSGAAIAARAGENLKKTVLELGGSDAFIVLADADLEQAVREGVEARYQNCGQSCIAPKRFLLHEAVADDFIGAFLERAGKLRTGDPLEPGTGLGPLAREDLRERLDAQVRASIRAGARPLLGCKVPEGQGWFYPPSALDGVAPGMPAWEQELFGPVAVFIRIRDEEQAVEVANATEYGLGSSIWTADSERALALARRIRSGMSYINCPTRSEPGLPFGGVRRSGHGRELGAEGIREFVNLKTIRIAAD